MSHEKAPSSARTEIYDVETLSSEQKVRMILEMFDLGKDKIKNEERKENFRTLLREYYEASVRENAKVNLEPPRKTFKADIKTSDKHKANLHNKIMEIIRNFSLSQGITKDQEKLTEYLSRDRSKVAEMIWNYFTHSAGESKAPDSVDHILRQARRGDSWFVSPPGKENE